MQKVLIPLDGSEFSQQILPTICDFFDPARTEIVLFKAIDPDSVVTEVEASVASTELVASAITQNASEYRRKREDAAKRTYQHGEALAHQHEESMAKSNAALTELGFKVSTHAEVGAAGAEIIRFAGTAGVDLIAMVTHGRTGLTRLLMGSIAEEVLRNSPVPVLLLRPT